MHNILLGKSTLKLGEGVVANEHLVGMGICHTSQQAAIKQKELESINILIKLQRHFGLPYPANLVYNASIHKPLDSQLKVLGTATLTHGSIYKLLVLLCT